MEAIIEIKSKIVNLNWDHLDNNEIMPAFFARQAKKKGSAQFLFNNIRYLPGLPKKYDPNFPLNKPENQEAQILIPGKFFATEIEEEQAVWALVDEGIRVVVSNNFGPDFKLNSYRNGLLPIELPVDKLEELEAVEGEVLVDLPNQEIITETKTFTFDIDQDYKEDLMDDTDRVSETLDLYEKKLQEYEDKWNYLF